jgi:hypothetical protein
MGWAGNVTHKEDKRANDEGNRPLGRPRRKWEDNIKMLLK